jgi:predicted enzyme related to lactoylglutathione lyase
MNQGLKTVIYPVRDLTAAKALFEALFGVPADMDEPYYVGYTLAGQHIGLDPHGHEKGMTGPVDYWHVDDIAVAVKELTAAGAREREAVRDVGGGRLVATLVDADDNPIGLIQSAW